MTGHARRRWTAERVRDRLARLWQAAPGTTTPPAGLDGYRDAAAVLDWFDPEQLRPLGAPAADPGAAIQRLLADCSEEPSHPAGWRLKREPRIAALRRLVERNAVAAALAANPQRPDEPAQRLLEAALTGRAIDAADIAPEELVAAAGVVGLLAGIVPGLPDAAAIANRIALEDILGPLRALANKHFRGRQAELAQLRALLHEPTGSLPLVIHGPGGMGKSTLLARFILDQVDRDPARRVPFAYLDFDRRDLSIRDTTGLIAEILRQLGVQYPAQQAQVDAARTRILDEREQMVGSESPLTRSALAGVILELLRSVGRHDDPFLLVLDTFEEVQYASAAYLEWLWELFDVLRNAQPRLMIAIAGRASVKPVPPVHDPTIADELDELPRSFVFQELELGELDREAALGFLASRGIADRRFAEALHARLGGNPLSLWLAADVAHRGETPELERLFLPFAQQAQIQGQLYRRILAHIHEPDVRRLAHPGLVLRVITPSLIREVLAEPCGVAPPSEQRALWLFRELEREVSLVTPEARGVLEPMLRHREDVRRVMLGLLRSDQPERIDELHRRAIAFHAKRDEPWNRAEEIYHRLARGEDSATIGPRWQPGIEDRLRGALEELAPRQRAYLASRLGIDLDQQARRLADLDAWERDAEKRIEERLYVGQHKQLIDALRILGERGERSERSPLILLEARVLERLDRLDEARRVAAAALAAARAASGNILEALRVLARIDEALGRHGDALDELGEALLVARARSDAAAELEIALDRTALLETVGAGPDALREARAGITVAAAAVPSHARSTQLVARLAASGATLEDYLKDRRLLGELNVALGRAFSRADFERLVVDSFRVPVEAIAPPSSVPSTVASVIRWAGSQGKLAVLVHNALHMRPADAALRQVALEMFPELRAVARSGGALDHRVLLDIRRAAQTAGLTRSRASLLYGLPRELTVKLPLEGDPMQQCLSDLAGIAALPPLHDGTSPIEIWLENAIVLAGPRREAEVFRSALEALGVRPAARKES